LDGRRELLLIIVSTAKDGALEVFPREDAKIEKGF
jgi:hypothetical protein